MQNSFEFLRQDVAFGARLLLKNRTFSLMAITTMALGIGSTTAVFSLVDGVLIRPLPYPNSDRLFDVSDVGMRGPFDTLRASSQVADYAAHLNLRPFTLTGGEWPERLQGSEVSANFFQVLDVRPLLGRLFSTGEDRPNARVVILSHAFWKERYAGGADAIGKQLLLDETVFRIIGVMPADFNYPAVPAKFWIPMTLDPRAIGDYWGSGGLMVVARLRNGASREAAASELRSWMPRIRGMFPWRMPDAWGTGAAFTPLKDHLIAGTRVKGLLLLGVVALVLLIAVVNVANLLIGRAAVRESEFALRASLGATPGRLARQLLTEAMLLATAGGFCGVMLAYWQLTLLKNLLPAETPRLADLTIDARVLAFTAVISLGSGLLFGLVPAWRMRNRQSLIAGDGSRATAGPAPLRASAILVMTEAAFATILLVGASLLLHSFSTMLKTDFGFQTASIITAELSPDRGAASSLSKTVLAYEQVRVKLASYPGVTNVAAMNVLPLTPEFSAFTAAIEDHLRPPQDPQYSVWSTSVTPTHLNTLGIRLLEGRGFTAADRQGSAPVVLIDRATARRYWPQQSAIGKHLRPVWENQWRTIVGVVEDVKSFSITGPPAWVEGEVYLPLGQAIAPPASLSLVVRIAGDPGAFEQNLPKAIKEVCANCAVSKITRMDTVVASAVQAPRSMAWLVGGFAFLAVGMAAAGIYGVVSHSVSRRTREIGVRLALGASRSRIAWLVLASSLSYTVLGIAVGLFASWALTRWIKTLLYEVHQHDALSFSIAPVLLITIAFCASFFPMYRAATIDPADSLREG